MTEVQTDLIRVLIVEDYKLVRVGIESLLNSDSAMTVVGEAATAEEGLRLADSQKPDVVLMDLGLPRMNGIEATRKIKEKHPQMKVIILTSHDAQDEVLMAFAAGAHAYCLKDIPSTRLLEVVKTVYEGAAWIDPAIAQIALNIFVQTPMSPASKGISPEDSPLAGRETEVLRLLVQGKNNAEIAKELYVSVHTVKAHVSNILQKLSVNDRVQAAVKAVQEGLV